MNGVCWRAMIFQMLTMSGGKLPDHDVQILGHCQHHLMAKRMLWALLLLMTWVGQNVGVL